jgi:NTP pyrophosphatase (non-canonical NTP hydrolase)
MSLKDVQREVDEWTSQFKIQYWQPHEILARLMEETGELAREINHLHGPKKKKSEEQTQELGDEMGDIIFTLCCLANSKGINLDESFQRVMNKVYGRDNQRFEKKSNL